MVEGHNVYHLSRKSLDRKRRVLTEEGQPDVPLADIELKQVQSVDWWCSSSLKKYPPHNIKSQQALSLRTNLYKKHRRMSGDAQAHRLGRFPSLRSRRRQKGKHGGPGPPPFAPRLCTSPSLAVGGAAVTGLD